MIRSRTQKLISTLWPVDWCHLVFILASTILLLIFRRDHVTGKLWMAVNLGLLVGLDVVRRWSLDRPSRQVPPRMIFALVAVPVLFTELGELVPYVNPADWEQRLFDFDSRLFNGNPLEAMESISHPLLTEYLQWIYDFYYFIPIILCVAVHRTRSGIMLLRMLFCMTLCLYLSYVGYYLVPATGPNMDLYGLYHFDGELRGVFLAGELREILFSIEKVKQNCFPSGHTALSVLCLTLAWRHVPRCLPLLAPLVVSLVFSTMYLRYHYVADVIGGVILALASHAAGVTLHRAYERTKGLEE